MGARAAVTTIAAAAVLAGCGGEDQPPSAPETMRFSSPAFADGAAIPRAFSCDGAGRAPALAWSGVPRAAAELVLFVDDTDAGYVHWTAYAIPAASTGAPGGRLPAGAKQGRNSAGKDGWTPPCPPRGDDPHHYVFSLYALKRRTWLAAGADPGDVRSALEGAAARGTFTGTYRR